MIAKKRIAAVMKGTICYWRGSAEVREDLIQALGETGYQVHVVRGLEELLNHLERSAIDAIFVDGTASQREASDRVVEVGNTEVLQDYPVIFLASRAAKRLAVLKGKAPNLVPLELPYRIHHVMRGVNLLLDETQNLGISEITALMNAESPPEEELESVASPDLDKSLPGAENDSNQAPNPSSLSRVRSFRPIEGNSVQNRVRLKANRNPARLTNTFGGEAFSIATHAEDFEDHFLLPDRGKRELFAKSFTAFEQQNAWAAMHARRVTFVATALAQQMKLSSEKEENIKLVCLFMNWANLDGASVDTKRHDLIRSDTDKLAEVAEAFRASAALIRERFSEERSARTVELVARLLLGEKPASELENELIEEAECVLTVEMSDRSCWSSGNWSPYGAYKVIQHLRGDIDRTYGRTVRCAMIRVLGEAVTVHVTVGSKFVSVDDVHIPSPSSLGKTGKQALAALPENSLSNARFTSVALSQLVPGMIVVKALKAVDGRIVLPPATRLDEEMVFRLWQLASIRTLESPVDVHVNA